MKYIDKYILLLFSKKYMWKDYQNTKLLDSIIFDYTMDTLLESKENNLKKRLININLILMKDCYCF